MVAARRRSPLPLIVGPAAGIAGWLLFHTHLDQPTRASFWFAVSVAFGLGVVLDLPRTRRIKSAMATGTVAGVLALATWLLWLYVFVSSVD